jgi:hypothetical protein
VHRKVANALIVASSFSALSLGLVSANAQATPETPDQPPAQSHAQTFTSFSELRAEVLNLIGATSKRLWLTTDYLTDGEIVTALYVAQYRKIDVRVLLGRAKASSYMSRLSYLKNQNIQVFLRPDGFKPQTATTILSDDKLIEIDGELDFMSKYKRFNLTLAEPTSAQAYATAFGTAAAQQIPANQRAMPLVGRQRTSWPSAADSPAAATPPVKSRLPAAEPHSDSSDEQAAYIYNRKPMPRPDGVATKLPKDLKWRQKAPRMPNPPPPAEPRATELEPLTPNYFGSHDSRSPQGSQNTNLPTVVKPLIGPEGTKTLDGDSEKSAPPLMEDTVQGGD